MNDNNNNEKSFTTIPEYQGTVYRYLSFTDKDLEDLEYLADVVEAKPIGEAKSAIEAAKPTAKAYLDIVGHKKDHRLAYLLKQKKLFRATPSSFNDPYDCKVKVSPKASDRNILNLFRFYAENQDYDRIHWGDFEFEVGPLDQGVIKNYQKETTTSIQTVKHRAAIVRLIERTIQKYVDHQVRLICFSKTAESMLMWSHYSDSHTGYCLEFNTQEMADAQRIGFYEIRYNSRNLRPLISLNRRTIEKYEMSVKVLLVKSVHWKYEEEVRLIRPGIEHYFPFKPRALNRIIVGERMDRRLQSGLYLLLATLSEDNCFKHVAIVNAKLDEKQFNVNIPQPS